jgi:hypothetical protein
MDGSFKGTGLGWDPARQTAHGWEPGGVSTATLGDCRAPDFKGRLLTAVPPFWERCGLGRDHWVGITHLARDGSVTDASEKQVVTQAHVAYSFAVGAQMAGARRRLTLAAASTSGAACFPWPPAARVRPGQSRPEPGQ